MNARAPLALILTTALVLPVFIWSGWMPYDRATWWMEVFPVLIAWPLMWWGRRLAFTPLLYGAVALHALLGGIAAQVFLSRWQDRQMRTQASAGSDHGSA